ncbi:MAG: AAA family ATPase [Paludibacteraceae bacterium]|nr:AAA family ATPase [Paludibacteraceae bacterium]
MLRNLTISNYVLIDRVEVEFERGFNVITGETGAGKSIMMGALGLLMGIRADRSAIKEGCEKCVVEGVFVMGEREVIVRREVWRNGRSRCFVEDSPVSLEEMRNTVGEMVDIHSQHASGFIGNETFRMQIVDAVAGAGNTLTAYTDIWKEYSKVGKELETAKAEMERMERERDYTEYQVEKLREANLSEGEDKELEEELGRLEHAEEMMEQYGRAQEGLEQSTAIIKEVVDALEKISKYTNVEPIESIREAYISIKDASGEISREAGNIEINPGKKDALEERLGTIYDLEKRYGTKSCGELIEVMTEMESRLEGMASTAENVEKLTERERELYAKLCDAGKKLTEKRQSAIAVIEQSVIKGMEYLGMRGGIFEVRLEPCEYGANGGEKAEFMFSGNEGVAVAPLAKIASGGEVSRVMLVLKKLVVESVGLGTIVFDEADSGVSGEMGVRMGNVMGKIAEGCQVISITHLASVAAQGTAHYKVYKDREGTHIVRISGEERVTEISGMIGDKDAGEVARRMLGNRI